MRHSHFRQQGYFLVIAVFFILIMATMASIIVHLLATRARSVAAGHDGLQTFYLAESGLEIGTRLLTMPQVSGTPVRFACSGLAGNAAVTNATLADGAFSLTALNSAPTYTITALSAGLSASSTTVAVADASALVAPGRIIVEREAIDYLTISGNTLTLVTRGAGGTIAASHASGAGVGQYLCQLVATAGIPSVTSPRFQRELRWNVQLQDGWAVGERAGSNFTFSRWNRPTEVTWNGLTLAGSGGAGNLNAVSMLSNADGWAAGNSVSGSGNFPFARWNGSAWQTAPLAGACTNQHLTGLVMVSTQEGWAVGTLYAPACSGSKTRYTVLRWNGSIWQVLTPSTSPSIPADATQNENLNAVHVADANHDGTGEIGFAVGDSGEILQYNGVNWVSNVSPTTRDLNGVYTVSASEAWAVGNNGVILRWNGSSWAVSSSPVTTQLNAIVMWDTNGDGVAELGWAVGNSGVILTYNGSWSAVDVGSSNLTGVDFFNANDVWATSSGNLYHWDGSTWSSIDPGTNRQLNAISLIGSREQPTLGWQQIFH